MTTVRRTGAASAAILGGLAAAIVFVHAVAPEWTRRAGLDVWNYSGLQDDARSEADRRATLEAEHQQMQREIELSEHLAGRVVAGQLTLAEAAAEMEPLLLNRPGFRSTSSQHYRAPNTRLGTARYLICKALQGCNNDATTQTHLSARLETEYNAMK